MQKTVILAILLIAVSMPLVSAKERYAIFGAGSTMKCNAYVAMSRDKDLSNVAEIAFAWVQGWLSARNAAPPHENAPLTVGGSISADTLKGFLVSECDDHPDEYVFMAADKIYDLLAAKGL